MDVFKIWVMILVSTCTAVAQQAGADSQASDQKTKAAIDRGLKYLERTQDRSGAWRATGYGAYPTAMTGLAGMAFLGSGSTPTRGEYARVVRKATNFLMAQAQADGVITVPAEEGRSMYGHGFATLFLSQVYGMKEDERMEEELKGVLTRAVELIARAQSPAGGWYYTPDSKNDEGSVTVTQIQALRACRNAGIVVPKTTIDRAVAYIRKSANPDGSIRYSLNGGGAGRPAITAAAVAVLYSAGEYDDPVAEKALVWSTPRLPVNGSGQGHHYYAQLYLAQALYQKGGKGWDDYFPKISKWLTSKSQQRPDGSWNGDGVGPTYGTAIALTILQLPDALVAIYQR